MWYGPTRLTGKKYFTEPFAYIYLIYDEKYNKGYIGKHTCYSDPFCDGYTGSGVIISNIKNNITEEEFKQRFTKYVLEVLPGDFSSNCEKSTVDDAERTWIDYYREEFGDSFLYNRTSGGDGGNTWNSLPSEVKDKIREDVSNRFKSKKRSKEFSDNLSKKLKGRKFTEDHKKHLSESLKATTKNKGENNPLLEKTS